MPIHLFYSSSGRFKGGHEIPSVRRAIFNQQQRMLRSSGAIPNKVSFPFYYSSRCSARPFVSRASSIRATFECSQRDARLSSIRNVISSGTDDCSEIIKKTYEMSFGGFTGSRTKNGRIINRENFLYWSIKRHRK